MSKLLEINSVLSKLENKKKRFLNKRFTQYVVEYRIKGDYLFVFSNIGRHCKVKNTDDNRRTLNRVIVSNKVDILNRITDYNEYHRSELTLIFLSCLVCTLLAVCVWLAIFIGDRNLVILSGIIFSIAVITTTSKCFDFYLWAKEVQNLKKVTNYQN